MNFGIILGAWLFYKHGWTGAWVGFATWAFLHGLAALFWPDMGRDVGTAMAHATLWLIGQVTP